SLTSAVSPMNAIDHGARRSVAMISGALRPGDASAVLVPCGTRSMDAAQETSSPAPSSPATRKEYRRALSTMPPARWKKKSGLNLTIQPGFQSVNRRGLLGRFQLEKLGDRRCQAVIGLGKLGEVTLSQCCFAIVQRLLSRGESCLARVGRRCGIGRP